MPGQSEFRFFLGDRATPTPRRDPEDPFRILLIGDFGGRTATGAPTTSVPEPLRVDIDTLDAVLARLEPRATLAFGDERVELSFREFDDFHPDALLREVPALALLEFERRQLRDPARAAAALRRLGVREKTPSEGAPASATPSPESRDSMFERLLGAPASSPTGDATAAGVDRLLSECVGPHLVPAPDPRVEDLTAALDIAATGLLREILHHPSFQRLEATWRGLQWLLQNLECDETLEIALLDLGATELAGLTAGDDPCRSPLGSLLVERAGVGARAFSLVVSLDGFSAGEEDVRTLAAMGAIGARAGFPFVATAARSILGCENLASDPGDWSLDANERARWQALRESPQASRLGLVLPRFLLRLPYGEGSDEIESFPFEEMPHPTEHERYLWGAPGLAVAMLLGTTFRREGWRMESFERELTGLPCHTVRVDGEARLQPTAEVLWTERAASAAASSGLMALQSHAHRDAARLDSLRSLAAPSVTLAGAWRG